MTGYIAPWYHAAACAGMDVNTFYPRSTDDNAVAYAKSICATCPVRTACLDDALAEEGGKHIDGRYGIRGGMSRTQRRREYEKRNRAGLIAKPAPAPKRAAPNPFGPKLDDKKRAKIRQLFAQGAKQASLARQFGVSVSTVRRVLGLKLPRSEECKPREVPKCGTRGGYQMHRRRGEEACTPCRQANTDADNRLRRTGTTKAAA